MSIRIRGTNLLSFGSIWGTLTVPYEHFHVFFCGVNPVSYVLTWNGAPKSCGSETQVDPPSIILHVSWLHQLHQLQ